MNQQRGVNVQNSTPVGPRVTSGPKAVRFVRATSNARRTRPAYASAHPTGASIPECCGALADKLPVRFRRRRRNRTGNLSARAPQHSGILAPVGCAEAYAGLVRRAFEVALTKRTAFGPLVTRGPTGVEF